MTQCSVVFILSLLYEHNYQSGTQNCREDTVVIFGLPCNIFTSLW